MRAGYSAMSCCVMVWFARATFSAACVWSGCMLSTYAGSWMFNMMVTFSAAVFGRGVCCRLMLANGNAPGCLTGTCVVIGVR